MRTLIIVSSFFLLGTFATKAQMSESGNLGAGLAWTTLNYGASAKYNFTENHTAQLIVGSANYGFGYGDSSGFSVTGRYLYNFDEGDISIASYTPYLYGQVGYWTFKYDLGTLGDYSFNSVAIGAGGGIEWSFHDFVDGLAFSFELGFTSVSFDGLDTVGGFNGGVGIHYYFNL